LELLVNHSFVPSYEVKQNIPKLSQICSRRPKNLSSNFEDNLLK
jgi:hypothetical protein